MLPAGREASDSVRPLHWYQQYKSTQPWLQRNNEDQLGSGEKQLLQSTDDPAKLVSSD